MSDEQNIEIEVALLRRDVEQLTVEVSTLRTEVRDLVDAWRTASNVVGFMKWLAGIATAVGVLLAVGKGKWGG